MGVPLWALNINTESAKKRNLGPVFFDSVLPSEFTVPKLFKTDQKGGS